MDTETEKASAILLAGGVGILPTDTLYGVLGSALSADAVDRIYALKRRDRRKPFIVLIAEMNDVERFGVVLSDAVRQELAKYWPGPTSIILPTVDDSFTYLDRGTDAIAFRVPNDDDLRALLRETGPLVAPSANVEGASPATTIEEARKYFGTEVDFYVDGGALDGKPSKLIALDEDGGVQVVRE
jgi:L-threonylcarbamoyladenylate synthase